MTYLYDRNVTQGTTPWIVSGTLVNTFSFGAVDAFGRQRVTEPYTLGDYKHIYGTDPNFISYKVNGGDITYNSDQACVRLSTTTNTSSRIVHQSKMYHNYMPGKSQFILCSFVFYSAVSNVKKRVGYYDDNNGIYFEQAGDGTLAIVIRSNVSGTPVETKFSQFGGVYGAGDTGWNVDACAGGDAGSLNPSGFDLDITKTQLFFIDFQWLGVGRVRAGFVHDGEFVLAHTFTGSNNLNTVYMSNPNLPQRCEVLNTGSTTGAYFDQICSTVLSEGGYVESGQDWGFISPTLRSLGTGSSIPILAIRLKTTFNSYANRMIVRLNHTNVFTEAENIKYHVIKLPDAAALTGGTWVSVNSGSGVEYNATATAISGGIEMDNGWATASAQGHNAGAPMSNTPSSAKQNFIVQNYDSSDSEIFVVYATNLGNNTTNVGVGLQWREVY